MKLNQLAGLGIASLILFGSIIEVSPAKALEASSNSVVASNNFIVAKKIIKRNSRPHRRIRHTRRRRFVRNRRRGFKFNFRRNRNPILINRGGIYRNHVKFDNSFSTGNSFQESHGRVRLF